jgi:BMFP domain-containing protein YqiC
MRHPFEYLRSIANGSIYSDALLRHTKGWNQRAQVMSRELDSQNEQIDRTRGKTENLETEMDYLDAKMKRQLKRN